MTQIQENIRAGLWGLLGWRSLTSKARSRRAALLTGGDICLYSLYAFPAI